MTQKGFVLTKLGHLRSLPRTYMLKGEVWLLKVVL